MADQDLLTSAELASKIKAKYPVYQGVPDDELVQKVTAKYPEYKKVLKPGPSIPTGGEDMLLANFKGMGRAVLGGARGAVSTVQGLASPIRKGLGMKPATPPPEETTVAGKIGRGVEQAAEFFVPAGVAEDVAKLLKVGPRLRVAGFSRLVTKYGKAAVDSALQATGAFGLAKAQKDPHAGITATVAGAVPFVPAVVKATGLQKGAEAGIEKVLTQGAKSPEALDRSLSRAVPLALEQGLPTSWSKWLKATRSGRQEAGKALVALKAGPAGDALAPKQPVIDALEALITSNKATHYVPPGGFVPGAPGQGASKGVQAIPYNEPLIAAAEGLIETLKTYPGRYLQARQLHDLKQLWDAAVFKGAEATQIATPLADRLKSVDKLATLTATNAIRNVLDQAAPDLAKLDEVVSAHIKLHQLVKQAARSSKAGVVSKATATAMGGLVGSAVGAVFEGTLAGAEVGAMLGGATGHLLQQAFASPLWRTLPAFTKQALANAIISGRAERVRSLLVPIVTGSVGQTHQSALSSTSSSHQTGGAP